MKTILYNPIFINPQAYYVFPRLTRYLQPDNESTAEPANYIGTIEVKVIAYGDTTLKRTYTNTDSIDLSEFKNTWIRISLFTKVGSCVLGEWKIGNMESDLPYIDPEVLASLKAVVIVGNKTNNDSDRAIVKNLVDPDNPFVISNAAYEGMSGYNGYPIILSGTNRTYQDKASYVNVVGDDKNVINLTRISFNTAVIFSYVKQNGALTSYNKDIESFKIKVTGIDYSRFFIKYSYISEANATAKTTMTIASDSIYELPKSFTSDGSLTSNDVWIGFSFTKQSGDIPDVIEDVNVTIEVISEYTGALVTDGVDDMITSTKTVQEMLGGSNKITVVSMIHQVKDSSNNVSFTNYIRGSANGYFRNIVNNYDKTGIYGYTSSDLMGLSVVNNILGDKNDYTSNGDNRDSIINGNFSVQGYSYNDGNNIGDFSSVAWYWTVIANKVLTTDQINQVIAYFNLDRTLKPDILCNTIKQGITNENHAEFGDKLIDFSGNGRDIQLNNIAWKGDSGIGKYEVDFLDSSIWNSSNSTITSSKIDCKNAISHIMLLYYSVGSKEYPDIPSFKVIKTGADIDYSYIDETGSPKSVKIVDGVNVLPASHNTLYSGSGRFCGFGNPGMGNSVTITQIPSHAGALCLDGVNDFGQFVGDLELKDYTFIADRAYSRIAPSQVPFIASTQTNGQAPFLMEYLNEDTYVYPHSFGTTTKTTNLNIQRQISYQSTYVYNGNSISKGTSVDTGDGLTIGNSGSTGLQYSPLCLWSLMLFPYSMSEFLIERQLKKHKLGTLYPDMVEFRPVIKSNASYDNIVFYYKNEKVENGTYLTVGSSIGMHIRLSSNPVNEIKSVTVNGIPATFKYHDANNNIYQYDFNLTSKSPQNINITIDEYIRYEDIVQPYPVLLRFNDENGNEVSWGGKFRVGSTITRIGSITDPESNLLNGLYSISGLSLNGKAVTSSTSIVEKQMVFKTIATYLLDNNEPKCILSPRLLSIPNSSYKILGYIPDISGHGNNGVINNSAYAEGSGVNEDGSYQFDGVDDFVTIPTTVGGKQVLMKVNWDSSNSALLYDQRGYNNEFAIYNGSTDSDGNPIPAYQGRNNGQTYIDGILNSNIKAPELRAITHNITITNELSAGVNKFSPVIGSNRVHNAYFTNMALYDFMLFDNISTDDKIKQLNEYVGIEGNTEWRKTK